MVLVMLGDPIVADAVQTGQDNHTEQDPTQITASATAIKKKSPGKAQGISFQTSHTTTAVN